MTTGPNQILIRKSDTAGVQPSGLSFGEPAINTADGRLFFSQQTAGTASGDFWEFRGFTDDGFVTSVNGVTGAVTGLSTVGISNGTGFDGVTAIAFGSVNEGVTFSAAVSGQTASVTIDLTGFEPATVFRRKYNYTVLTGALNTPNANANGDLEYNQDTGVMSIFKTDKDGNDFKTELNPVAGSGVSGRVLLTFGDEAQSRAYEFDSNSPTTNYDANTNLDLLIDNISNGSTAGTGKVVGVEIQLDTARQAARSMRLPGNGGTTFDTVVTSFNGVTGAVTTTGLVLDVTGISSSGGITLGGDLQVTDNNFDIVNADGNKVFDLTTRNVKIGDCDGAGNSTSILIRDSHNVITQTAATSITLNTANVPINSKLSHNGDSNTYLDFPAADTLALTAGGVTLANLTTAGFQFPQGLASDGGATFGAIVNLDSTGIKFSDGTSQTTAASGSGGGGATQSIGFILDGNGSPLTTGDKLDALKQVPFDCQVLNTSAFIQDGASGPTKTIVFGVKKTATLSSSITGTTLEIGNTGSADQIGFTFDGVNGGVFFRELANVSNAAGSTIGSNDWIFPDITGNSGDIDKLQIFMTVIPT